MFANINRFSLKDDVRKIVALGDFDINPYAQSYIDGLDKAELLGGEQGVRSQALYIASNLTTMNDEQDKRADELLSIGYNKPYTNMGGDKDILSEIQYERLVGAFTEYSADKKNAEGLIDTGVFASFAEKRGVPLEWALAANDWPDEMLDEGAKGAVANAWRTVKIKGINV